MLPGDFSRRRTFPRVRFPRCQHRDRDRAHSLCLSTTIRADTTGRREPRSLRTSALLTGRDRIICLMDGNCCEGALSGRVAPGFTRHLCGFKAVPVEATVPIYKSQVALGFGPLRTLTCVLRLFPPSPFFLLKSRARKIVKNIRSSRRFKARSLKYLNLNL